MKPFVGMLLKSIPVAGRFREFRTNRVLYIIVFSVMVFPYLLTLVGELSRGILPRGISTPGLLDFLGRSQSTGQFSVLFVAFLGVAILYNDRSRGTVSKALEGPMTRDALWLAKLAYGAGTIVMANVAILIIMIITALGGGMASSIGPVIIRTIFLIAMQIAVLTTALALGGAIGSLILIVVGLAIVFLVPVFLAVAGAWIFARGGVLVTTHAATILAKIDEFSPLNSYYPVHVAKELEVTVLYVAWALFLGYWGLRWWERIPLEKLHEVFFFPWLWNLFYAFMGILSAIVVTGILSIQGHFEVGLFLVITTLLSVPGWYLWRTIVKVCATR